MNKVKILVVDADDDTRTMLDSYFTGHGYEVTTFAESEGVFEFVLANKPDIMLVEFDGSHSGDVWELIRTIRRNDITKFLPMIFLSSEENDSGDCLYDVELGADDYVTKPFDSEELKLRVTNAIQHTRRRGRDSVSGFLTGLPLEEYLRNLLRKANYSWSYVDLKVHYFEGFKEVYDWQAADDVIREIALAITDAIEEHGTQEDFAGHPVTDNFIVISHATDIQVLVDTIIAKFTTEIPRHYYKEDRERAYILLEDKQIPLMTLGYGICDVSALRDENLDIGTIYENAVADRRKRFEDVDNE